ncbi:MAG: S41 family peptidase [Bacteroidales bacterium]|nr:S41 family peptidase [Bacteroidales bacterium]
MIRKTINPIIILLCIIVLLPLSNCAQEELTSKDKVDLIDKASKLLNDNYVFPDVASKIEKHLKSQLLKGVFNSITNQTEFAEKLTSEMQSISNDKHMRCFSSNGRSVKRQKRNSPLIGNEYNQLKNEQGFSFCRVGIIDNNIGVLDIYGFPESKSAEKSVDEAMNAISSVSVLIIDLRRNGGGSPDLIRYICSYFFDKPTHINSIYWRSTNKTVDFITSEKVVGKKLTNIPVYVLTSSFTFSGGEEFAYNFQTQKRGTLIGEVTGGGANPGDVFPVNEYFEIFIPTGRAINPITKTNWEGNGVKPDIEVEAAKAFEVAISKIQK